MEAKAVIPGGKPSIFVDDSKMLPWEVESCYELVSRALVTRLHAAVFCYRLGKPFTALSYEPKIEGFMQSIGRKALRIDADPDEIYEDLISAPKLAPSHKIDLGGYREIVLEAMS